MGLLCTTNTQMTRVPSTTLLQPNLGGVFYLPAQSSSEQLRSIFFTGVNIIFVLSLSL